MARNIVVLLDGEESSFDFKAIDRAAINGKRRRVALDRDGEACNRASLTEDGSVLIKSGMTGQAYFDEAGQAYKLAELVAHEGGLHTRSFAATHRTGLDFEDCRRNCCEND